MNPATEQLGLERAEQIPLPDGDLRFWPRIELGIQAEELLDGLIETTSWRQEQITVYGKPYLQPRLSAWFGDSSYRYSGITLQPGSWTPTLLGIRHHVEALAAQEFNSVLLNYYRDGNDSMGMHSDDERELGSEPVIASLSLGETRNFTLKHKYRKDLKPFRLALPSGSLLIMRGKTQRYWRHGIAKSKQAGGPRINLTFRLVKSH